MPRRVLGPIGDLSDSAGRSLAVQSVVSQLTLGKRISKRFLSKALMSNWKQRSKVKS